MKLFNLTQQGIITTLKIVGAISFLLLITACGPKKKSPTPTVTLQPVATMTPMPTATVASVPTETSTPLPPTDTPTAVAAATPTVAPTDTPAPPVLPTDTPTATPALLIEVSEARIIYHDGQVLNEVGKYKSGVQPWIDLLVRMGDTWYGPERLEDDIDAAPLPEGYRWEVEGGFASFPSGEAWWTAPGVEGKARLIGPDGNVLYTLELEVEFY